MSATTNTKYEKAENPYIGKVQLYLSRACSVEISIKNDDESIETFRCNLSPIFTFVKQKLKNVDWEHISRTRDKKWGYKRLEADELFDMLSNDKI